MKTIKIAEKEYQIDCNALTYVKYKDFFKEGILQAVGRVQNYLIKQAIAMQSAEDTKAVDTTGYVEEIMKDDVDDFIITITKLAWIFIYTANHKIEDYEKWLEGIQDFNIAEDWIIEVTNFAIDCFRGSGRK